MRFKVLQPRTNPPRSPRDAAYLITDNWNDWGKYRTQYYLIYIDMDGVEHAIGDIKIGELGLQPGPGRPNIPPEFDELDTRFFSVGQDDHYYVNLNKLGDQIRIMILSSLRDMAADPDILPRVKDENVTGESLLRSVSRAAIEGQFRRIAGGGARLTEYEFTYLFPEAQCAESLSLNFNVVPESHPPTNVHVVIGRNGVGKTTLLNNMAKSLLDANPDPKAVGSFVNNKLSFLKPFANLVSVTFSAFDPFEAIPDKKEGGGSIGYSYLGLKTATGAEPGDGRPKSHEMLAQEFVRSVGHCLAGTVAKERWRRALRTLEADPIFSEADVASLVDPNEGGLDERASMLFKKFSSGHKIVLLTITKLVQVVEECTLVLFDEPEAHLHPPLLAALIRAVSDLLIDRNGVALIATHSPVVLQEVPSICTWKLFRAGHVVTAERPELETFGENVGTLTRDVFGLEVTHSGFHQMLQQAVDKHSRYEEVLAAFGERLGAEAKGIVRTLLAAKSQ